MNTQNSFSTTQLNNNNNGSIAATTTLNNIPLNIPLETLTKDTPLSPPPSCRTPTTQKEGNFVSKFLNIPLESTITTTNLNNHVNETSSNSFLNNIDTRMTKPSSYDGTDLFFRKF